MDSYILKLIEENKKLKEQLRKQKTFKRGDIVYVQMTSRNIEKCSIEEIETADTLSHKLSRFCCIMRTN